MRKLRFLPINVAAMVCLNCCALAAFAQQIHFNAPFQQTSNGFFEQSGVGFGIRGPNFFFQQNSFGQALPQFGGYNPASAANLGYSLQGNGWDARFNFSFGQGAQSNLISTTPSLTLSNGAPGGIFAGQWTPFVVGAIPVVGDAAPGIGVPFGPAGSTSVLDERLSRLQSGEEVGNRLSASSSAAPPVPVSPTLDPFQQKLVQASAADGSLPSVAEIERRQRAEAQAAAAASAREVDNLEARGEAALRDGKPGVARIYFRQAAARATGARRQELLDKAPR